MSSLLVGIDIGTSSVKSLIMNSSGQIMGLAQQEYDIQIPKAGYAEQDPAVWWRLTCDTLKQAMRQAGAKDADISGIGFSGQMHGLVAVDESGQVLRPAIIWCDQRTIPQKEALESALSVEQLGALIQNPVATGFQLLSLLWIKEHEPLIYRNIRKVMSPKDYVRYRMTGEIASEMTDASGTAAFSPASREWSRRLLEAVDVDPELFPAVQEPWKHSGTVTRQAAEESGLAKGTPVVYGGADQPMQAIGNGIIHPGTISCTIGTGGQLFAPIDAPVYDPLLRSHSYVHAFPCRWYLLGATMSAGLSLKWLANQILGETDYRLLDEKASTIPAGSEKLLFLPYLTGDRTPHMDPYAKGIFFGLTLKHSGAHMVRAVMEGVAFSLRDSLEIFHSLGVDAKKIIVSGGGAKSALWSQMLADILEQDVYASRMTEQACVGAALIAGVGVGQFDSIEQGIAQVVQIHEEPIRPQGRNRDVYRQQYEVYRALYDANQRLFLELESPDNKNEGVIQ
ncbi:xylulokinase [Paenibacillus gansuensis]|uniref:Xylulose kinase n=1 Tax=Paenibacillus gansuensis TaxID=306542 RepID=A0ABW5PDQ7_9BACL